VAGYPTNRISRRLTQPDRRRLDPEAHETCEPISGKGAAALVPVDHDDRQEGGETPLLTPTRDGRCPSRNSVLACTMLLLFERAVSRTKVPEQGAVDVDTDRASR